MTYLVVYEQGLSNWGAYAPDLPGCIATGGSLDEVKVRMKEAIRMHIELLRETGQPVPSSVSMGELVSAAA